jgi:hypothetical protein
MSKSGGNAWTNCMRYGRIKVRSGFFEPPDKWFVSAHNCIGIIIVASL